jgi:hypothetical protein
MTFSSTLCSFLLAAATVSSKWIVPGARWRDTEGNLVNAHAGSVTIEQETGKFFLFGEYKVEGQVEGGGVSVYSSDDLATWEHHGMALSMLRYTECHSRSTRCVEIGDTKQVYARCRLLRHL